MCARLVILTDILQFKFRICTFSFFIIFLRHSIVLCDICVYLRVVPYIKHLALCAPWWDAKCAHDHIMVSCQASMTRMCARLEIRTGRLAHTICSVP